MHVSVTPGALGAVLLALLACAATVHGNYNPNEVPRCYKTNEEYTACGSPCPATCASVLETEPTVFCPALCVPGCFCKEGYVRNRWNNCIPRDKCPCNRPNELYTCGSSCQTTCNTLNQDCPITDYATCRTACYCKDGYARDTSGICIPAHKCGA